MRASAAAAAAFKVEKTPCRRYADSVTGRKNSRGIFITFEGGEGAGKTTQIALLDAWLRATGNAPRLLREPGGTALGEDIRAILKHAAYGAALRPRAELLLFAASRAQLVAEVIRPALDAGETVLCDRFTDSSIAYQGGGRALPVDAIRALNEFATGGLRPDLTVLLDLPAAEGMERARRRAAETVADGEPATGSGAVRSPRSPSLAADRMESLDAAFYERVRQTYLGLAAAEPQRFLVADARLAPPALAELIRARVAPLL